MNSINSSIHRSQDPITDLVRASRSGNDPSRDNARCRIIPEYFRSLPRECPSSLDLILDGRFGPRPANRLNDLTLGTFDGHHDDIERLACGHGVYRWRLHAPTRPGYPKHKSQALLSLPAVTPERLPNSLEQTLSSSYILRVRDEGTRATPLFRGVRS